MSISVRASRPVGMGDDEWADLMEKMQPHRPFRRTQTETPLRLGLEFEDGSTVIANDRAHRFQFGSVPPDEPLLTLNGGGGGGSEDDYNLGMSGWLWPFPPKGPLRLIYDWAALQLPEGSMTFSTDQLHSAREQVVNIWTD